MLFALAVTGVDFVAFLAIQNPRSAGYREGGIFVFFINGKTT
jgi:hypothetical protein